MAERRRPLRVHLVHQSFGDYVGGLVDGLAPAVAAGDLELRVTTLSSGASTLGRLRPVGVDHEHIELPRFRDPRSLLVARRAVRQIVDRRPGSAVDVVHWQAAGNPWVDLAFSRAMGAVPTVVTVHDMQAHPGDANVLPLTFRAIRRVARRADRLIVHAPHIAGQASAIGVSPARISVLAHGELATRYRPLSELPLPPSPDPTVLFFGRAQGYKGLDLLVAAMPEVVARVPGARLVVAGSGPSLDEQFPADRPIPAWSRVVRGRVDDEQVVELFGRAAVVALPYREASQSGVAALAAGFGRPVVASGVPGLADIVEPGVSGMLIEPGSVRALADALVEVLGDAGRRRALGVGAWAAAAGPLAWDRIGASTIELYHRACEGRDGARRAGSADRSAQPTCGGAASNRS